MKTHLVGKRSVDSGDSVGIELSPVGVGEVDLRRSKSGSSNEVEGGVSETRREENEDATRGRERSQRPSSAVGGVTGLPLIEDVYLRA